MGLLADFLAFRKQRSRAEVERFAMNDDQTWPSPATILPGGLGRLSGTHSDPPLGAQPWVDGDGKPHFFAGRPEE